MIAMAAVTLLVGASPLAGDEQFPRGLMSAEPAAGSSRTCTIDVRPVSFGTYDALAGNAVDAVGQVIYACGNFSGSSRAQGAKAIRIELDTGLATTFQRRMSAGTGVDFLAYNLYLDATHRTIWGNGTNGTDVYVDTHPPNRTPVIVPVFGRIPGNQNVTAGQYADSLLARIVF
jgi:spore coat protein U-like protein